MELTTQWQYRCAAAAYACCDAIGHAPPAGTRVEIALSPMRGNIRPLAIGGTLIEDCYNANPIAMNAALADLVARPGRHVAILADMFELGSDERELHLQVGAAAADAGVDLLIGVGTRGAWYVQGAGDVESVHFRSVEDAVAGIGDHLRPDDVVLLKGSRGMALERLTRAIAADAQ
jgi:UDP-N-acetylmuramoyl-tripeptide--D-alanyl-D-alanine ligase